MKTKKLPYLNPERIAILNHIWNRALANGREVNWQDAFQDHPDWADRLGWEDPVCKRNCYQFIGRRRRNQPEGAHTAAGLLPPEPSPTTDLHFCPRCGFNISMLHAAFQVAMKHTQQ